MNNKLFSLIACFALIILACQKDYSTSSELTADNLVSKSAKSGGSPQIAGVGFLATNEECNSVSEGATFAVRMTGDLEGCLYVFIDNFDCSPSGTYREEGREHFVGMYNGTAGTFWTRYKFESKYEGCAQDGSYLGLEIFGRCEHPIVKNSGTGVFEGATGRVDMKDDVEAGNYPYRGHINF